MSGKDGPSAEPLPIYRTQGSVLGDTQLNLLSGEEGSAYATHQGGGSGVGPRHSRRGGEGLSPVLTVPIAIVTILSYRAS